MTSEGAATKGVAGRVAFVTTLILVAALTLTADVVPVASAAKGVLSGTMTLSSGAPYATTSTVTVDSTVREATVMRLQNGGGSWSAWTPYAPTTTWILAGGDGVKTVLAQYRTASGRRPLALSDDIVLDTTAPVTTTDFSGIPAALVTIVLTASDTVSGLAGTSYRIDGGPWQDGTLVTLCIHKRREPRAGDHTLEYFSTDHAGNVGPVQSLVVTLRR